MKEKKPNSEESKPSHGNDPAPPNNSNNRGSEWTIHNPRDQAATPKPGQAAGRNGQYVPVSPSSVAARNTTQQRRSVSSRDAVREKLLSAGVLATDLGIPHDLAAVSDEELERTGDMLPGARPSEALVDEDRGR
ncbi:MAG: hypothetical protein ABI700_25275 [Chloroflexota bacterium]